MNQALDFDTPSTACFRSVVLALLICLSGAFLTESAKAQTPVTKVKDSDGSVIFKIIADGGLVAYRDGSSGIPATGAGNRMMWYADKSAFRAGQVGSQSGKEDVWDADSVGSASVAFGQDTRASGGKSTALGQRTIASGSEAVAMGQDTEASGTKAVAMGLETTASGFHSLATGNATVAEGNNSLAGGLDSKAGGANALAMGRKTEATANNAIAMGNETVASESKAFAVGGRTVASGVQSTAMGGATKASSRGATAMGLKTRASGKESVAMGKQTTAQALESVAIGRWNTISGDSTSWVSTDPLFVAGNGSGSSSRSNALLLKKNGNMEIAGTLTESSDRRLKTDIQELGSVIDDLKNINPVRFHFKEGTGHPQDQQVGLIAQDVQRKFPELVRKNSEGYLSLAYPKLTAVLLKGLQEQQATIEEQKEKDQKQKAKIENLQAENDAIKERLAAVEQKVSGEGAAEATLMDSWTLVFLLGLGLGGVLGLLARRRSGSVS